MKNDSPRRHWLLLVDDHADTTYTLAKLLRSEGYDVSEATSVRQALALCREHRFDLLLADLELGDGDGIELLEAMQKTCAVRAIAITGLQSDELERQARAAGFEAYLLKPFTVATLLRAVRAALGEPAPAAGPAGAGR